MDLSLSGKVVEIVPPQTYNTKNGERTRYGFVIETDDRYPKRVKFSVEDAQKWDAANIHPNQVLRVAFDLESRSYTGQRGTMWFTEAKAWKIDQIADAQPTQTAQAPLPPPTEAIGIGGENKPPF